jgi:hypothetical protein
MNRIPYLIAAAAISGLALTANPASASPLTSGLGGATVPEFNEGLVQKVHGYHCRKRWGWYRGHKYLHRHRRACAYHRPGVFIGVPFVGLSFGLGHRHRHHHHHHGMWWD